MSYLDELRKSRDKPQVVYQEFALSTKQYPEYLFCFFEGKDNSYYVSRIKRVTDEFYSIKCGNKQSVIDVYNLISSKAEYEKYKKGFFIDRDFDSPIMNNAIFETPCYSIENLYTSVQVFKNILINEFHLSEIHDNLFTIILDIYKKRQNEYHEAVLLLNSWYSCLIDYKEENGINIQVNLSEKNPREFLDISIQAVVSKYDILKIKEKFPDAPSVHSQTLEDKMNKFKISDKQKIFRGKWELDFLLTLIKKILKDSYQEKMIIKEKINFAFGDGSTLSQQQVLNIFEAHAETPKELMNYLTDVVK